MATDSVCHDGAMLTLWQVLVRDLETHLRLHKSVLAVGSQVSLLGEYELNKREVPVLVARRVALVRAAPSVHAVRAIVDAVSQDVLEMDDAARMLSLPSGAAQESALMRRLLDDVSNERRDGVGDKSRAEAYVADVLNRLATDVPPAVLAAARSGKAAPAAAEKMLELRQLNVANVARAERLARQPRRLLDAAALLPSLSVAQCKAVVAVTAQLSCGSSIDGTAGGMQLSSALLDPRSLVESSRRCRTDMAILVIGAFSTVPVAGPLAEAYHQHA
eukprot:6009435-Pleurochrysis_carterae.AAC.1